MKNSKNIAWLTASLCLFPLAGFGQANSSLNFQKLPGGMILSWSQGSLKVCTNAQLGLWQDVAASSPYYVAFTNQTSFFRVSVPTCDISSILTTLTPLPTVDPTNVTSVLGSTNYPIVCNVTNVTLADNYDDIVLFSPAFLIYPGAIVSARSAIVGSPQEIIVNRTPITISVLGPGGLVDNSRVVDDPFAGSVDSAINDILLSATNASYPAFLSYTWTQAYSQEQTALKTGLGAVFGLKATAGFDFSTVTENTSVFFKIVQRFFTVEVRPKATGAEYLDPSVTCSDIEPQLQSGDVPLFVSSVDYGRILIYQITASSQTKAEDVEAAFSFKVLGAQVNPSLTNGLNSIFENADKRLLVLGGDPNAVVQIISSGDAAAFFNAGNSWNNSFLGVPLVYHLSYMGPGLQSFSYGTTTSFQLKSCAPMPGNHQWRIWQFGCDDGHDNVFALQRDGTPICGSGNCPGTGGLPGTPGSCWANPQLSGNIDGSLQISQSQDTQMYGRTYLYTDQPITFSVPYNGDVLKLWVNDQVIAGSPATFALNVGWNKVEFTSYNQNQGTSVSINAPLGSYVLTMDSDGPNTQ